MEADGNAVDAPERLCCPISEDIMRDPVLLIETGQTYDRASIESWFARGHSTCPLTGKAVANQKLVTNFAIKSMVEEWAAQNKVDLTSPHTLVAPKTSTTSPTPPTAPATAKFPTILMDHTPSAPDSLAASSTPPTAPSVPASRVPSAPSSLGSPLHIRHQNSSGPVSHGASSPGWPISVTAGGIGGGGGGGGVGTPTQLSPLCTGSYPEASSQASHQRTGSLPGTLPVPSHQHTGSYPEVASQASHRRTGSVPTASPAPTHQRTGSYPDMRPPAERPADVRTQTENFLQRIRSPYLQQESYLQGLTYDVGVMRAAAADHSCRDALLQGGAVPILVTLLSADKVPELQAKVLGLLARLCGASPAAVQSFGTAGGLQPLRGLLSSASAAVCEGAACLVYASALQSPQVRGAMAGGGAGQAAVIAPFETLFREGSAAEVEAGAWALSVILPGVPPEDCSGSAIIPRLAQMVASRELRTCWLAGQLLTLLLPANRQRIVQEVATVLSSSQPGSVDEACRLFWMWGMTSSPPLRQMVSLYCATPGFLTFLGGALHSACPTAPGLLQMMVFEDAKVSNSLGNGFNVDGLRLMLVSQLHALPALLAFFGVEGREGGVLAALHALANLTAYRSGACPACTRPLRPPATCRHCPAMALSEEGDSIARLLPYLECADPLLVSATLAVLNNLCCTEETRERLVDAAKSHNGVNALLALLTQILRRPDLAPRGLDAARSLLQRLPAKRGSASTSFSYTMLLLPPPPVSPHQPTFL